METRKETTTRLVAEIKRAAELGVFLAVGDQREAKATILEDPKVETNWEEERFLVVLQDSGSDVTLDQDEEDDDCL